MPSPKTFGIMIEFNDDTDTAIITDDEKHRYFIDIGMKTELDGVATSSKAVVFTPIEQLTPADQIENRSLFDRDVQMLLGCARFAIEREAI